MLAAPGAQKSTYYRVRRDEARRRIDELTRSAGALAEGQKDRARVQQLAALVRVADARYDRLPK
jgi:hypothetical protein